MKAKSTWRASVKTKFLLLSVTVFALAAIACASAAPDELTTPAGSGEAKTGGSTAGSENSPDLADESLDEGKEAAKESPQPAPSPRAAEIEGIDAWINSDPLTIEELEGKVVLVDFWTYTCINCIRTFPYLKLWHSRYADDGLVIVGIHTPEFEFEKSYENVARAAQENGILWPIAQDNDYVTWRNYSNRYWPAKYLVDRDGVVRYTHFGEGAYAETEEQIRLLLEEAEADLSDDPLVLPEDQEIDQTFLSSRNAQVTPELYAGYERNFSAALYGRGAYVIQGEYFQNRDQIADLAAPAVLEPHKIYFNGPWSIMAESAQHARETAVLEDYIALGYSAKSVNAVLTSESDTPYRVVLTMNDRPLTSENRGRDVIIGEDGQSYIEVDAARLYELVDNPTYLQSQNLKMSSNSADFGLFAFTFGVYEEGP